MDAMKKARTGDPLVIPAQAYNAFVDAAKDFQQRTRHVGQQATPGYRSASIVQVKNESGADRERFDVLGLGDPIFLPGDVSDMSGTLMLDQRSRAWSPTIIETFDIDRGMLPSLVESHEPTGRLRPEVAQALGLSNETIVVGGAGDQQAGAVGAGVVAEGITSATTGTSGVVFVHSGEYAPDPRGRVNTFCAAVAGEYCMFGCMLAVGGSFQWFRNVLGRQEVREASERGVEAYDLLTAEASEAPPGCEGLFWLPYLTGERTPHADPHARACWIGITSRTDRPALIRSVLEGATFAMNDAMMLLRDCGRSIEEVRLAGGGARSAFWRQLQADIFDCPCVTLPAEEGPAFGAALLAAVGDGAFGDVREACRAGVTVGQKIPPDPERAKRYAVLYERYRGLYPALRESFRRMARTQ
jgi:xylulokinase